MSAESLNPRGREGKRAKRQGNSWPPKKEGHPKKQGKEDQGTSLSFGRSPFGDSFSWMTKHPNHATMMGSEQFPKCFFCYASNRKKKSHETATNIETWLPAAGKPGGHLISKRLSIICSPDQGQQAIELVDLLWLCALSLFVHMALCAEFVCYKLKATPDHARDHTRDSVSGLSISPDHARDYTSNSRQWSSSISYGFVR